MFFGGEGKEIHPYIPGMLFFLHLLLEETCRYQCSAQLLYSLFFFLMNQCKHLYMHLGTISQRLCFWQTVKALILHN